jgi:hypothetical protein
VSAQKLKLLYENHLLVWHKKIGTGVICKSVFGMAQKIWTSPKYFGTRKRTGQKSYALSFTGRKMFFAGPNFLSQPKNLTAFRASSKTFVQAQKPILLNANHLLVWHKMFVTGTICK